MLLSPRPLWGAWSAGGQWAVRGCGPAHGHSPDEHWEQQQGYWALPHSLNRRLGGSLCLRREGLDPSRYTPQHLNVHQHVFPRRAELSMYRNTHSDWLPARQCCGKRLLMDELLTMDTKQSSALLPAFGKLPCPCPSLAWPGDVYSEHGWGTTAPVSRAPTGEPDH